jgi:hypothetical protein
VAELFHGGWRGVAVELESRFCDTLEANLADADVTIHCPVPATPLNIATLLKVRVWGDVTTHSTQSLSISYLFLFCFFCLV